MCVYAPVVAALAFTYVDISPWTAFLFLAPALAAQQLFSLYQEKARLYEEQLSLYADLKAANTSPPRREPVVRHRTRADA